MLHDGPEGRVDAWLPSGSLGNLMQVVLLEQASPKKKKNSQIFLFGQSLLSNTPKNTAKPFLANHN